jgi:glycosyltransferase involved in cell wall biosynthesis
MPYGGEETDHEALLGMDREAYLFPRSGKYRFVYAGALLPKAHAPLDAIFRAIASSPDDFADVEFHFIGTGLRPDDPDSHTVRPHAERHGLWGSVVFEHARRIPYLDVLIHLAAADAVFILGSTEPHYTPSKTYQAVLSGKPILAVLHGESTAVGILRETGAGQVLDFPGEAGVDGIADRFIDAFRAFRSFADAFDPRQVDRKAFDAYSARAVTRQLADLLDRVFKSQNLAMQPA